MTLLSYCAFVVVLCVTMNYVPEIAATFDVPAVWLYAGIAVVAAVSTLLVWRIVSRNE